MPAFSLFGAGPQRFEHFRQFDRETVDPRLKFPARREMPRCAKLDARMSKITVQLTPEELQALVTLTENQFFRIKYLDPKMPGYKGRPKEVEAAQSAVHILQTALRKEKGFKDLAAK
jgi:hypothetical protein